MKHLAVISHYNEPLRWVEKLDIPYLVYSRTRPSSGSIINTPNVGREPYVYLKYVADNYENLPDRCVFVHGHENSYHQLDTTPNLISRLDWAKEYCSINHQTGKCGFTDETHWEECGFVITGPALLKHWKEVFEPYLYLPDPPVLHHTKSAQFMVSRERLHKFPKEFYVKASNWFLTTTMDKDMWTENTNHKFCPYYISGRMFEWTWDYMYA